MEFISGAELVPPGVGVLTDGRLSVDVGIFAQADADVTRANYSDLVVNFILYNLRVT